MAGKDLASAAATSRAASRPAAAAPPTGRPVKLATTPKRSDETLTDGVRVPFSHFHPLSLCVISLQGGFQREKKSDRTPSRLIPCSPCYRAPRALRRRQPDCKVFGSSLVSLGTCSHTAPERTFFFVGRPGNCEKLSWRFRCPMMPEPPP